MRVLAIDQGTTATKAFLYDDEGRFTPLVALEHRQIRPHAGWVEHDALELLDHVLTCVQKAGPVDAIGIDNQGETVVAWNAETGDPIYNAIVWQDDRTRAVTDRLKLEGAEALTMARAGLPLDPYFSASKLAWLLENVPEAKRLAAKGALRLGTSDAYFLGRLTRRFVTDVTTASRTSLMNLTTGEWDEELCRLFGVPVECLPVIGPSAGEIGQHIGIPVTASLVDQQAALNGHGCDQLGRTKITFGTGAFALVHTGPELVSGSKQGINATIAWQILAEPAEFALEGGIYNAASAVNWAKGLGLFADYTDIAMFDGPSALSRKLVFVPALSGLGAPYWDRSAAGCWLGLGLDTGPRDMMQALLEGVALRAGEIVTAIARLAPLDGSVSVDGGLTRNAYFNKFLSRVLNKTVVVPASVDLTALGTARLAMRGAGVPRHALPPLPDPRVILMPDAPLSSQEKGMFSEAIERARGWK